MRIFVAVDINDNVRRMLSGLQKQMITDSIEMKVQKGDAKWVQPELIHLTLKFLGEIDDNRLEDVKLIVSAAAEKTDSFEISIESAGCFGKKDSASVLWVGIKNGKEKLVKLAEELDDEFSKLGFEKEQREFSGHLTLCRVKNPKAGRKLAALTEKYKNFKAGAVKIVSVKIYQSQLRPDGPVYSVLADYKLK